MARKPTKPLACIEYLLCAWHRGYTWITLFIFTMTFFFYKETKLPKRISDSPVVTRLVQGPGSPTPAVWPWAPASICMCYCLYCSLPGRSVHGVLQARTLEWVAMPSSRGSSQPRDGTQISCTAGRRFILWSARDAPRMLPLLCWINYRYSMKFWCFDHHYEATISFFLKESSI